MSRRKERASARTDAQTTATDGDTDNTLSRKAQLSLRAIESELPHLEDELLTLATRSLKAAMRYGELLTTARGLLEHGQWLPWLKEHTRVSQPTAWNWMKLYERRCDPELAKLLRGNDLVGVTEAYYCLGLRGGGIPSDELNPVRKSSKHELADDEDDTYTLLLSEEGIKYFIETITAPDASPMKLEVWEILAREVNRRLKELGGAQ
jgi:Protein of unknown function (DUF3102)